MFSFLRNEDVESEHALDRLVQKVIMRSDVLGISGVRWGINCHACAFHGSVMFATACIWHPGV